MNACITRETFCFYSFSASVSFDFETRIMSTCMSTSRSNYFDMSIWKKHADHSTTIFLICKLKETGLHAISNELFVLESVPIFVWTMVSLLVGLWASMMQLPLDNCEINYRGFAEHDTHLYVHHFALLLGSSLYSAVWRKTTKHHYFGFTL